MHRDASQTGHCCDQEYASRSSSEQLGTTSVSQQADPVCGMTVSVSTDSPHRAAFAGREYVFCSNHCREKFQLDPQRYASAVPSGGTASNTVAPAAAAAAAPGTIYT